MAAASAPSPLLSSIRAVLRSVGSSQATAKHEQEPQQLDQLLDQACGTDKQQRAYLQQVLATLYPDAVASSAAAGTAATDGDAAGGGKRPLGDATNTRPAASPLQPGAGLGVQLCAASPAAGAAGAPPITLAAASPEQLSLLVTAATAAATRAVATALLQRKKQGGAAGKRSSKGRAASAAEEQGQQHQHGVEGVHAGGASVQDGPAQHAERGPEATSHAAPAAEASQEQTAEQLEQLRTGVGALQAMLGSAAPPAAAAADALPASSGPLIRVMDRQALLAAAGRGGDSSGRTQQQQQLEAADGLPAGPSSSSGSPLPAAADADGGAPAEGRSSVTPAAASGGVGGDTAAAGASACSPAADGGLPGRLGASVQRTLAELSEPAPARALLAPDLQPAAVCQQQQRRQELDRMVNQLLGSRFDYHDALQQLEATAQAVHAVTTAAAVGDGADGGDSSWLPAAASVSPLVRFYQQEDRWTDLGRFSKAVEEEVTWRLAAAGPAAAKRHKGSARGLLRRSCESLHGAGKAAAAAGTDAVSSSATLAAGGAPGTADAAAARQGASPPAAASKQTAPATTATATGGGGSGEKQRPVVAFGRRVDAPLVPATGTVRQRHTAAGPSAGGRLPSAAQLQPQGPQQQLPRFVEPALARPSRGGPKSAAAQAPTSTALQRLQARRLALRAAAAAAAAGGQGDALAAAAAEAALLQQLARHGSDAGSASSEMIDTLVDAILDAQQQDPEQQQPEQQDRFEPPPGVSDMDHLLQLMQHERQLWQLQQAADGQQGPAAHALQQELELGGAGRRFAAVHDLLEPPTDAQQPSGAAVLVDGGAAASAAAAAAPGTVDVEAELLELLVDEVMGQRLLRGQPQEPAPASGSSPEAPPSDAPAADSRGSYDDAALLSAVRDVLVSSSLSSRRAQRAVSQQPGAAAPAPCTVLPSLSSFVAGFTRLPATSSVELLPAEPAQQLHHGEAGGAAGTAAAAAAEYDSTSPALAASTQEPHAAPEQAPAATAAAAAVVAAEEVQPAVLVKSKAADSPPPHRRQPARPAVQADAAAAALGSDGAAAAAPDAAAVGVATAGGVAGLAVVELLPAATQTMRTEGSLLLHRYSLPGSECFRDSVSLESCGDSSSTSGSSDHDHDNSDDDDAQEADEVSPAAAASTNHDRPAAEPLASFLDEQARSPAQSAATPAAAAAGASPSVAGGSPAQSDTEEGAAPSEAAGRAHSPAASSSSTADGDAAAPSSPASRASLQQGADAASQGATGSPPSQATAGSGAPPEAASLGALPAVDSPAVSLWRPGRSSSSGGVQGGPFGGPAPTLMRFASSSGGGSGDASAGHTSSGGSASSRLLLPTDTAALMAAALAAMQGAAGGAVPPPLPGLEGWDAAALEQCLSTLTESLSEFTTTATSSISGGLESPASAAGSERPGSCIELNDADAALVWQAWLAAQQLAQQPDEGADGDEEDGSSTPSTAATPQSASFAVSGDLLRLLQHLRHAGAPFVALPHQQQWQPDAAVVGGGAAGAGSSINAGGDESPTSTGGGGSSDGDSASLDMLTDVTSATGTD